MGKPTNHRVSRRNFLKQGAVAGVSAAALGGCATETSAQGTSADGIKWDYEADVLVIGSGASGLPCAIRARDAGLRVLVIDQNFDVGGKMLHSGGQVSLGGGDPCQLRDIAGQGDKEGFIKVAPLHKPEDMTEDTDFLFRDITDWSVLDVGAHAPYRYNDREHASRLGRQLLRHAAIPHGQLRPLLAHTGHALRPAACRARGARPPSSCSATRPTSRREPSRGRTRASPGKSSSHFAPRLMESASKWVAPGAVWNGAALTRGLEFSAREKGIQFMLNRSMTEIVREQPFAGRVAGRQGELYAAVRPGHRRAAGEPLAERQRRRAPRHRQHPGEDGGLRRQRRSQRQSAVPQHVLSRVQRARVRVERMGAARAARPGRQRHHRRHADRRQSFGHAAEPRDHPELPHPAAAGDARRLHRHAARPPDLPVPPLHRHHARHQLATST